MIKTTYRQKILLIILSIFFAFVILEAGLRVGGFMLSSKQRTENKMTGLAISDIKEDDIFSILTIGESTTASGIMGVEVDSWPSQIERILKNRTKTTKFKVFNEGLGGTNTAFILANLEKNLGKYKPDMVITMMGSNDKGINVMYDDSFNVKINLWFQDLRVYKLLRWIKDSWKNRLQNEKEGQKLLEDNVNIAEQHNPVSEKIDEYIRVGRNHLSEGELDKAEELFRKAIAVDKSDYQAYLSLGDLYYFSQNFEKAAEMYEKAIGINPSKKELYPMLGICYGYQFEYDKAEKYLIIAHQHDPNDHYILGELGRSYLRQGKIEEAKATFDKLMEYSVPDFVYRMYTENLIELNYSDKEIQKFYNKRGYTLSLNQGSLSYNLTKYHYQKLYEILKKRDIKYIAMQYPTLGIESLKKLFNYNTEIIFISNEDNFNIALKENAYDDLFIDRMESNWGHATTKGNRLIAENVAEIVLGYLKIEY